MPKITPTEKTQLQLSEDVGLREDKIATAAKYGVGELILWYLACLSGVIHIEEKMFGCQSV